jgi:hypothetical protein
MRTLKLTSDFQSPNIEPGDFYLTDGNIKVSIGVYVEFQVLDDSTIRILHSLIHDSSNGEIAYYPNSFEGDLQIHRLSSSWHEEYCMFVPSFDYPCWPEHRYENC